MFSSIKNLFSTPRYKTIDSVPEDLRRIFNDLEEIYGWTRLPNEKEYRLMHPKRQLYAAVDGPLTVVINDFNDKTQRAIWASTDIRDLYIAHPNYLY